MEPGDIIYIILLVFFMILGFFNDSRKKKNQKKQLVEETPPPAPVRPLRVPVKSPAKEKKVEFQSSLDQVSNYKKYDSGDNIEFDYDINSFDDPGSGLLIVDHPVMPDTPAGLDTRKTSDGKNRGGIHPLVVDLQGDNAVHSLKKGLIYTEILQRRY